MLTTIYSYTAKRDKAKLLDAFKVHVLNVVEELTQLATGVRP